MQRNPEREKELAALEAVKYIKDGMTLGLGTGSTVYYAVRAIGEMVQQGLNIRGVATSAATQQQAISLGIPMTDTAHVTTIDLTIDGADEFDRNLDLVKGGGGALFKEKIIAAMSKEVIIIADASKKVDVLGEFKLPLEVVPFAANYVMQQVKMLNGNATLRQRDGQVFKTEQGNYIFDADFGLIQNAAALSAQLNNIEGLLVHGLFIQTAHKVIMGDGDGTVVFER
jgi:ribose 5-phosphate isomerase A